MLSLNLSEVSWNRNIRIVWQGHEGLERQNTFSMTDKINPMAFLLDALIEGFVILRIDYF